MLASVRNGINVLQSDLESGLAGFENESFDCMILSQTLQAMRHTEGIVREVALLPNLLGELAIYRFKQS